METEALLDDVETRVLGALIEKQITTPDYYPLTLNSLTAPCNQKSNRYPVVSFDEKSVVRALDSLLEEQLARRVSGAEMRVPKYYHLFTDRFSFTAQEVAVLCVLMLRGAQTVGEIRGRSGRLFELAELSEVEETPRGLAKREDGALVKQLPRQPGRNESRFAHLLAGELELAEEEEEDPRLEPAALEVRAENERIAHLEEEVESLHQELEELKAQFADFRS